MSFSRNFGKWGVESFLRNRPPGIFREFHCGNMYINPPADIQIQLQLTSPADIQILLVLGAILERINHIN